jgi:hypothetical protein
MSCDLTKGRLKACKSSIGGLAAVYWINYIADAFTYAAQEVTAINVAVTEVFKYDLRNDENQLVENVVSDRNTGTTVNTQTLTIALQKLDKDTSNEVKLLAYGNPIAVVKDKNGNHRVAGIENGLDLTASNIGSGGAAGDFNGYNLTLTGLENEPAPFLNSATVTALEALVSATNIDPEA